MPFSNGASRVALELAARHSRTTSLYSPKAWVPLSWLLTSWRADQLVASSRAVNPARLSAPWRLRVSFWVSCT